MGNLTLCRDDSKNPDLYCDLLSYSVCSCGGDIMDVGPESGICDRCGQVDYPEPDCFSGQVINPDFSNTTTQKALYALDEFSVLTGGIRLYQVDQSDLIRPTDAMPVLVSRCGEATLLITLSHVLYQYKERKTLFMAVFRDKIMHRIRFCVAHLKSVEARNIEGLDLPLNPLTELKG